LRRSVNSESGGTAGFTLIEALIALAVVAVALTAIGSLIATTVRNTLWLGQRLALVETARAVATGLPDRGRLAPGSLTGEVAAHRWRLDVAPYPAAEGDPRRPPRWVPLTVVIRVQAPGGQLLQLDSVRLVRGSAP
jgi:general secretion pathway protein I